MPAASKKSDGGGSDLSLKCSHCGKLYSTRKLSVLRAHERMHTGELPFECLHPGCTRRFSRKDCMMVHYMRHSVVHTCSVPSCGMTFGSAVDLFRHRRFHNSMCDICGESFQTLPLLRIHKLKDHNESEFKCTEDGCTASFTTRHALKWHSCSHLDQKFVCLFAGCSKMFKTREDLELHHALDSHTSANTHLPAESSIGTSSSSDSIPVSPSEVPEPEVVVADTSAPTSSVSLNIRSRISSEKEELFQNQVELVTVDLETSDKAPRRSQRQAKSKSIAAIQESTDQESAEQQLADQELDMVSDGPMDDTALCENGLMSSITLLIETAGIRGSEGSRNCDEQPVEATATRLLPIPLPLPIPTFSASGLSGSGSSTGSLTTAESTDQCPAVSNAISVSTKAAHVAAVQPSKIGVIKDVTSSGSSSSARKHENRIDPSPVDSSADKDKGKTKSDPKSNRRKRRIKDDDDDDDNIDDDYVDEEEGESECEADSDFSKSDDNTETESGTRKRSRGLKGFDFHCPIKDCSRSFNKKSNLVAHITAIHSSSRPFVCTVRGCGQSFGFKHVLQRHHKNIHIDGKNPRVFVSPFDSPTYISQSLLIGASNSSSQSMRKKKRRRESIGVTSESNHPDSDSGSDSEGS